MIFALLCPALALTCHALDHPDSSRRDNLTFSKSFASPAPKKAAL